MMKYITIIIFILSGCAQTTQSNNELVISDSLERWLIYGMPESLEARNYVAQEYGFKFLQVAGCVVEKDFTDSVDKENVKLDSMLKRNYGSNWKLEFERKVDILENKFDEVHSILRNYKPYLERKMELETKGYFVTYDTRPIDTAKNLFNVILFYYLDTKEKPDLMKDELYEVDLTQKSILQKNI